MLLRYSAQFRLGLDWKIGVGGTRRGGLVGSGFDCDFGIESLTRGGGIGRWVVRGLRTACRMTRDAYCKMFESEGVVVCSSEQSSSFEDEGKE